VQPASSIFSSIDTTQRVVKIDGRHCPDADQVAQQALNIEELFVHVERMNVKHLFGRVFADLSVESGLELNLL